MPVFNNALAGAAGSGGAAAYEIERSLRFEPDDTAYLNRTPSSAGSNTTWTLSTWVKKTGNDNHIFGAGAGNTPGRFGFGFNGSDKIFAFVIASGSTVFSITTDAVFRDPAGWYHIVLIADTGNSTQADRFKIYVNGVLQSVSGTLMPPSQNTFVNTTAAHAFGRRSYTASDYFDGYLADVHFIDGQALTATDFGEPDADTGVWNPIKYSGSYGTNGFHLDFSDNSSNAALGYDAAGSNNWTVNNLESGALSTISSPNRPTWNSISNWTVSNNSYDADYTGSGYTGIQATLSASTTYHFYLTFKDTSGSYGGWYLTDSSSAPSNTVPNELGSNSFGLRTGHTQAGTHGTYATANGTNNGSNEYTLTALQSSGSGEHSVEFVINTTAGKVWARKVGNTNWVGGGNPSNSSSTASFLIPTGAQYFGYMGYQSGTTADFKTSAASASAADIDYFRDSPTNYEADSGNNGGNYCTWNPLVKNRPNSSTSFNFKNGNLEVHNVLNAYGVALGTIPMSSGKWFWEITVDGTPSNDYDYIGIIASDNEVNYPTHPDMPDSYWYRAGGTKLHGSTSSSYGATYGDGDVIGIALDLDSATTTLTFYKNGVSQGTAFSSLPSGKSWLCAVGDYSNAVTTTSWKANWGQRPFTHTPPTGFKSLCTQNLPDPLIADGSEYFQTELITGNNSTQAITTTGMSPDFVWLKRRNQGTYSHSLVDSVRGAGKRLASEGTYAEDTFAAVSSFDSEGFTLGNTVLNETGASTVAWAWDAGSSNTSISDGSLNSSIYDRSKAWTSLVTTSSLHNSYNSYGSTSKLGAFDGKSNTSMYSASGPLTITFDASAFPASGGPYFVEVETNQRGIKVNGQPSSGYTTDIAANQATYWANNGSVSSLTSIEVNQANSAYGGMTSRIRVNGKVLADRVYDDVTWSNALTPLANSSLTNPPNGFDGNESTYADSTNGFTLDLSGHTFGTGAHTIEVKSGGATSFTVNGSTSLSTSGSSGAVVWTGTYTGELTSLASSASGASVYYVKIDGSYLLNPGQDFVDNYPSIASTVRANPTAGFSIVSYTGNSSAGSSIGHNLNAVPELIIIKNRDRATQWPVGHAAIDGFNNGKQLYLSTTGALDSGENYFNATAPTSSVFTVKDNYEVNYANEDYIAYCFAPVEGYSAVGKWTGGSDQFVYLGFRPKFLLVKANSASHDWLLFDSERSTYNRIDDWLSPNLFSAEQTGNTVNYLDFLSNGFKIKGTGGYFGTNADMLYIAFAEHPFKTARAR